MTDSERIKELKKQIRQLKKSGTGGGDFRVFLRLHVLIAYYKKQPIERIAQCYDISTKTINRWILRYESGESDTMQDKERQGRPTLLNTEQQAELKKTSKRIISAFGLHDILSYGFIRFLQLLFRSNIYRNCCKNLA